MTDQPDDLAKVIPLRPPVRQDTYEAWNTTDDWTRALFRILGRIGYAHIRVLDHAEVLVVDVAGVVDVTLTGVHDGETYRVASARWSGNTYTAEQAIEHLIRWPML